MRIRFISLTFLLVVISLYLTACGDAPSSSYVGASLNQDVYGQWKLVSLNGQDVSEQDSALLSVLKPTSLYGGSNCFDILAAANTSNNTISRVDLSNNCQVDFVGSPRDNPSARDLLLHALLEGAKYEIQPDNGSLHISDGEQSYILDRNPPSN